MGGRAGRLLRCCFAAPGSFERPRKQCRCVGSSLLLDVHTCGRIQNPGSLSWPRWQAAQAVPPPVQAASLPCKQLQLRLRLDDPRIVIMPRGDKVEQKVAQLRVLMMGTPVSCLPARRQLGLSRLPSTIMHSDRKPVPRIRQIRAPGCQRKLQNWRELLPNLCCTSDTTEGSAHSLDRWADLLTNSTSGLVWSLAPSFVVTPTIESSK
jgi:hypothetical protein